MGSKWVRVLVRLFTDDDAFVLTAYGEQGVISGEEIWRKQRE